MNVKSRIHRIIKDFDNYQNIDDENAKFLLDDLELIEGEIPYGVYENIPREKNKRIVITSEGMHLYKESNWIFIKFIDIKKIKMESDKQEVEHLNLELTNGESINLPVKGQKGKFKDIFQFVRFLDRVISDLNKQH